MGRVKKSRRYALDRGIYSPSLVDAALNVEENIYDVGLAFRKALAELIAKDSNRGWVFTHKNGDIYAKNS